MRETAQRGSIGACYLLCELNFENGRRRLQEDGEKNSGCCVVAATEENLLINI